MGEKKGVLIKRKECTYPKRNGVQCGEGRRSASIPTSRAFFRLPYHAWASSIIPPSDDAKLEGCRWLRKAEGLIAKARWSEIGVDRWSSYGSGHCIHPMIAYTRWFSFSSQFAFHKRSWWYLGGTRGTGIIIVERLRYKVTLKKINALIAKST